MAALEIREFAERVLFATTLEEKLASAPADLLDEHPGAAMDAPGLPGRPSDLVPKGRAESGARFPGEARLVDEHERASLLHFFANHELLAVELMALALLRFPDAPKAFRQGVVRTLQEEQEHTRWYMARMAECGLGFGDLSVSRMIWDQISTMESPLDYVSRLSLTFEQANLDYAHHYSRVLRDAGDVESAAILGRIYRDEIDHVGYGLQWLRRWKEEKESDWEAWRRRLQFPLTPMRAKGLVPFNVEGRRRAGLDEAFIRQLRHFQQSRGRAPDVWFFNPDAEEEIAATRRGVAWHPPARLADLAADLEPAFALAVAGEDDMVALRRAPSLEEQDRLAAVGFAYPEVVAVEGVRVAPSEGQKQRKRRQARAWAATPAAAAALDPLSPYHRGLCATSPGLFSKERVAEMLERLAEAGLDVGPLPVLARSAEEVRAAVEALLRDNWTPVVAKEAVAAAGRGNHLLTAPPDPGAPWLAKALATGPVLVEPWFPAALTFSLHADVHAGEATFRGLVHQEADASGRWRGAVVRRKPAAGLAREEAEAVSRILTDDLEKTWLPALREVIAGHDHEGPLGVDTVLWRGRDGVLRWRPAVDVNPRWTMGRLAHELRRRHFPGRTLRLAALAPGDAVELPPPVIEEGRLASGAFPLTPPSLAKRRVMVVEVR